MDRLFVRALLAFLVLPATIGYLVPWLLILPATGRIIDPLGLAVLGLGTGLLLWCVRDFYVAGKGTLAPWSPPQRLVVVGAYRFSRNPMYVAVILVLWGWALGFRSIAVAVYALAMMLVFHLRVVLAEEPYLARVHGEQWLRYRAEVTRWLEIARKSTRHRP